MKKWLNEAVYSISRLRRECNKHVNDNVIVNSEKCHHIPVLTYGYGTLENNEIFNACVIHMCYPVNSSQPCKFTCNCFFQC